MCNPNADKALDKLFESIYQNDVASVREHLPWVQDLNALRRGISPLHVAVETENFEIIALLLEAGADINRQSSPCLWTPLQTAIARAHDFYEIDRQDNQDSGEGIALDSEVVSFLLKYHPNLELPNCYGLSALDMRSVAPVDTIWELLQAELKWQKEHGLQ